MTKPSFKDQIKGLHKDAEVLVDSDPFGLQLEEHSPYSASGAHRWLKCPGSIQATKAAPPQEPGPWAEEGTLAHGVCADMLLGIYDDDCPDEEMIKYCDEYTQYCLERAGELNNPQLKIEHLFHLKHIHPELYGTSDFSAIEPFKKAIVIDFKYGQGVSVVAENNPQLMYYALGATWGEVVEEVEMVIYQPRANSGPTITSWTLSYKTLKMFAFELLMGIERAKHKEPVFLPGEKQCKFCPAKTICPALKNQAQEVARISFSSTDEPNLPMVEELDNKTISRVMTLQSQVIEYMKAVGAEGYKRAQNGQSINGFKLVKAYGNRAWVGEKEDLVSEMEKAGASVEDMYTQTLLSPAQMEKLGSQKKTVKGIVEKHCEKPDKGVKLVPESNKAPAVKKPFTTIEED